PQGPPGCRAAVGGEPGDELRRLPITLPGDEESAAREREDGEAGEPGARRRRVPAETEPGFEAAQQVVVGLGKERRGGDVDGPGVAVMAAKHGWLGHGAKDSGKRRFFPLTGA